MTKFAGRLTYTDLFTGWVAHKNIWGWSLLSNPVVAWDIHPVFPGFYMVELSDWWVIVGAWPFWGTCGMVGTINTFIWVTR
jgi:hypothetical protein